MDFYYEFSSTWDDEARAFTFIPTIAYYEDESERSILISFLTFEFAFGYRSSDSFDDFMSM